MAFSVVQHKSATGSSAAPSATFTSTPTQGNLLVAGVYDDATSAAAITMTSTGWTALTDIHSGNRAIRLFWKIAGAGESTTVTAAATSGSWAIAIAEYSPGGLTVNAPTENAQANASGTVTTPTVTPASGLAAVVVCWIGASLAETWSAEQVNSSATGVNVEEVPSRSGAAGVLFDLDVASTSGSYSGSATASASTTGGGAIAVFTGSPAAPAWVPSRPPRTARALPPAGRSRAALLVPAQPITSPASARARPKVPAAARGRRSGPALDVQATPPGKTARRPRRLAATRRARPTLPQPATDAPRDTRRPATGRRLTALRRGTRTLPTPAQVPVPAPVFPNRVSALARRLFSLQPRGRQPLPTQPQVPVPPEIPGNLRPTLRRVLAARPRRTPLIPSQDAPAVARPAAPRRALGPLPRGRRTTPVGVPQAPPPQIVIGTRASTLRRLHARTRGSRSGALGGHGIPPATARTVGRWRTAALRRGARLIPSWLRTIVLPPTDFPTDAALSPVRSSARLFCANDTASLGAHPNSLAALRGALNTAALEPAQSTAQPTPQRSTAAVGAKTSNARLDA